MIKPINGEPCGYGETLADIVRELREKNPREEYPAEYGYGEVPNEMRKLADRIEAAAKKEREEIKHLRAALANARNCEYAANVGCECHGMRQVREFESEVK